MSATAACPASRTSSTGSSRGCARHWARPRWPACWSTTRPAGSAGTPDHDPPRPARARGSPRSERTSMTTDTEALATGQDLLRISPVVPVVVLDDAEDAVPLARALARGGVRIMEITLRTPAGLASIERVAAEVPETVVGAGTVTTPEEAAAAQRAGARFIVTPGATDRLLSAVLETGLPLLAGASTLTEILRLREHGLQALKFFPAEAAGGTAYLRAVAGPVPDVRFCPTGGITPGNAGEDLALAHVARVGGARLTPRAEVRAGNWGEIERLAGEAAALGAVG